MAKLTEKVDAMDSKLDLILSILLFGPGHDAKKGRKSQILMILMKILMIVRSQIIIEGGGGGLNMIWVVFISFQSLFTVFLIYEYAVNVSQ